MSVLLFAVKKRGRSGPCKSYSRRLEGKYIKCRRGCVQAVALLTPHQKASIELRGPFNFEIVQGMKNTNWGITRYIDAGGSELDLFSRLVVA
jgi:hypothetical protein